jgi:DNA polymerase III subunit epsilon
MMSMEAMIGALEKTGDYRVLRRLKNIPVETPSPDDKINTAAFVDVETTGLDVEKDKIVELCLYPFQFNQHGRIVGIGAPLHYYNDPEQPLNDEVKRVTGLTDDKLRGHKIDIVTMEAVAKSLALVVAHHADFDRKMMERLSPVFAEKWWGCSMNEVPWDKANISGRRLEYIMMSLGYYYEAHTAVADCEAGIFSLQTQVAGQPALLHVMNACRQSTYHVWALKAAYKFKDTLKARGYQWNGGEDGRPKSWHKVIPFDGLDAEIAWLERAVYNRAGNIPARFDLITGKDRYSKRG